MPKSTKNAESPRASKSPIKSALKVKQDYEETKSGIKTRVKSALKVKETNKSRVEEEIKETKSVKKGKSLRFLFKLGTSPAKTVVHPKKEEKDKGPMPFAVKSVYNFYVAGQKEAFEKEHPKKEGEKRENLMTYAGAKWKNLSDADKAPWNKLHDQD